jgi:hypothetical protein
VMPRGTPDLLQVVVLAARSHALLRGRRAPEPSIFLTEKDALELNHSSVGEQEGLVVGWHERRTWFDLVSSLSKIVEESAADFGGFHRCVRGSAHCSHGSDVPSHQASDAGLGAKDKGPERICRPGPQLATT